MKLKLVIFAAVLLTALALAGCQDFGQFPAPAPPAEQKPARVIQPTTIASEEQAILAVYEHLLTLAQSAEAKVYLAQFSAMSEKWAAEQELFRDGTSVWYVRVDSTGVTDWKGKPYWQEASWFVYPDGKVIPSNRLKTNALLIEADLQKLSTPPKS